MSFLLGNFFHISPMGFNDVEYYEFLFHYERALKERQLEENITQPGMTNLTSLLQDK